MMSRVLLLATVLTVHSIPSGLRATDGPEAAQGPPCAQPLATLSVGSQTYTAVDVSPVNGRVYVYLGRLEPLSLWIVEGVYAPPFTQSRGSLDEGAFEQIRKSGNVRATRLKPGPGNAPLRGSVSVGKDTFVIEVVKVAPSAGGAGTVTVAICR